MRALTLAFVALTGCGGTAADIGGTERLVPNGGSFYDQQLQIECSSAIASDGVERCLPQARARMLFADPKCTVPALVSADGDIGCLVSVGDIEHPVDGGFAARVHTLGERHSGALYDRIAGWCAAIEMGGSAFFDSGTVAPEGFAKFDQRN